MKDIQLAETSDRRISSHRRTLTWPSIGQVLQHNWVIKSLSVIILLAAWELVSSFFPPSFLPGPDLVAVRMVTLVTEDNFFFHAYNTIARTFAGFVLALVTATVLGIAMGVNDRMEKFLDTYVLVGLTIPGLCWAVIALMWFGITEIAPVFAIFVTASPMIMVNIWQGTKAIDKDLLEMGQAFRAKRGAVIREIVIPQLLPYIFAATRFGFALGWKVVVLSEMFGLSNGVGYMINRSFAVFSMVSVLAWTVAFTLVMFVLEFGVLKPIERHFTRWRPSISL